MTAKMKFTAIINGEYVEGKLDDVTEDGINGTTDEYTFYSPWYEVKNLVVTIEVDDNNRQYVSEFVNQYLGDPQ